MSILDAQRRSGPGRNVALLAVALGLAVAGCASQSPPRPAGRDAGGQVAPPAARSGGYYLDDGPGARPLQEIEALAAMPDPVPIVEPLHRWANRPYRVLGNDYLPMTQRVPFVQQGIASWYGRRFHGQPTSTGEPYDMYGMTAAHPTLPLPSYARVTHLGNGRSVVVRINDRGPFLHNRVIDLSYLAAYKLDYVRDGSAPVKVELLDPAAPTPAGGSRPAQVAGRVVNVGHAMPAERSAAAVEPAVPQSAAPAPAVAPTAAAPIAASPASASAPSAGELATSRPAVAAADASPPAVLPEPSAIPPPPVDAHYLQLGAFGSAANAEAASASLQQRLGWLQVPIGVQREDGLYRVQAGPYQARDQAARAGAEIEARTGLRPLLLPREPR